MHRPALCAILYVKVTGAPMQRLSLLATTRSRSELAVFASLNNARTVPTGMSRLVVNLFCCTKC
ncbi:hypothetical protein PF002_g33057 [Phytophthora fragariae]|uniref:Uncharacterized protein n=1 Tax=Phytophthora fragariae TaxID=53985 RepID=A0A6A3PUH8_9STRA|nr:hypothetical protein PF003_g25902 [Phytophthora fragariae]KAE8952252.1 hypothetical protein PF011_g32752 [Phytophthora fragariae]KAE9054030.1 hypothetical protein PF007_g32758 [Phytophthora fragariae]KAE9059488.1 hypothetical protein PF006_g31869 [Phytophthora fragariae]KAE9158627.1 hypothetical protein PF002_g33057 [Phytophthora fragariae]